MSVDLPPGEKPEDELSGFDAVLAMQDAFAQVHQPAARCFAVKDLAFRQNARGVVLHVRLREGKTLIAFDVQMPKARARQLALRLRRVLKERATH